MIDFPSGSKFIKLKKTVSGIKNSDEYLRRFISTCGQHLCFHAKTSESESRF